MVVVLFPPQFGLNHCVAVYRIALDFFELIFIVNVVTCFVHDVTLLVGILLWGELGFLLCLLVLEVLLGLWFQ
jgi:hypothetical protein